MGIEDDHRIMKERNKKTDNRIETTERAVVITERNPGTVDIRENAEMIIEGTRLDAGFGSQMVLARMRNLKIT